VNPAPLLREVHERLGGCVMMSATLRPEAHWSHVLGLEDPVGLSVPSPFPPENRRVVIVPSVRTTLRERSRQYARIARLIERVVAVRPGRYVAYFPSFPFLEEVRSRLRVERVLAQRPDADRCAVLERVQAESELLLLAVLGGVFAEGIDMRGLAGAIVVGPGLPAVSDERAAMAEYFEQLAGDGWERAMVVPGMQRVVQAAGRVHRTPDDRGVIVLLGERFTRQPYADHLPPAWARYGPAELVADDPVRALAEFWGVAATRSPARQTGYCSEVG
jgi:DNA excision repair protein ERCC-2